MKRDEIIARLCKLQSVVYSHIDARGENASDCFCWDRERGGIGSFNKDPGLFRHDGLTIDFIERAVLAAIARGDK